MNSYNSLGGYLPLELVDYGSVYHDNAIQLNSGRNCLEVILREKSIRKIFLPYFVCDVVMEPITRLNVQYEFYFLDNNLYPILADTREITHDCSAILYVNYFGLCTTNVQNLTRTYSNCIIDCSQAFFQQHIGGCPTFYSPRKFFGVPDGGQLYLEVEYNEVSLLERDYSVDRMTHLLTRLDSGAERGYKFFQTNERALSQIPVMAMSNLTSRILRSIDFSKHKKMRRKHFEIYHERLGQFNEFSQDLLNSKDTYPMVYPLLNERNSLVREKLLNDKVYTATYWPNVLSALKDSKELLEYNLSSDLLALPVDQNLTTREIGYIIELVLGYYNE